MSVVHDEVVIPAPSAMLRDPLDTFHPSYLDEIANACRGPAVQLAISFRIEQLVRHGHDRDADQQRPADHLPREARARLSAAIEQICAGPERRNLPVARRNLARCAALCLAAIDRLDAELTPNEGEP